MSEGETADEDGACQHAAVQIVMRRSEYILKIVIKIRNKRGGGEGERGKGERGRGLYHSILNGGSLWDLQYKVISGAKWNNGIEKRERRGREIKRRSYVFEQI